MTTSGNRQHQLGIDGAALPASSFLNHRSPAMKASSMCEISVAAPTASS
ncbi:hypothetical protein [Klebsiella pneumoniae IS46]|nr:hypothetical protein [Klebsiella pneumoniae IS46]